MSKTSQDSSQRMFLLLRKTLKKILKNIFFNNCELEASLKSKAKCLLNGTAIKYDYFNMNL